MKLIDHFFVVLEKEKNNFLLWIPVLFGFGAAFYLGFSASFSSSFFVFLGLFVTAILLSILDRFSFRSLIFGACSVFLAGCFYADFYDKIVLDHAQIEGKVFVDAVGKVEDIRKFYNPVNKHEGANLLISNPVLYKSVFVKKDSLAKVKVKKKAKKKAKKKKNKKTKNLDKIGDDKLKEKKPRKPRKKKTAEALSAELEVAEVDSIIRSEVGLDKLAAQEEVKEKKPRKSRKKKVKTENVEGVLGSIQGGSEFPDPDSMLVSKVKQEKSLDEKGPSLNLDANIKTGSEDPVLPGSKQGGSFDPMFASKVKQEKSPGKDNSDLNPNAGEESASQKFSKEKKKPKIKKPRKISDKKIQKTFINIADYQDVDRKFLDYSKNYQQVEWQAINGRERFPNPPLKISANLIKNFENIAINDIIAVRLMLQPPRSKEFPNDFDFISDARSKKIGAYGFVLGEAKIVKKADVSSSDDWFLSVREAIRDKITAVLKGDSANIALAFLIGDQSQISKEMMINIRNSGLAHLLSISGFHLALASVIFLVSTRFILSRSEYLALHLDLKKVAAIIALAATYFYLKIAASPVPAQRAFLMVAFISAALFVHQKADAKRSIMAALLFLLLANPYNVFNVSFQLSFAAMLTLVASAGIFLRQKNADRNFIVKFFFYFLEMIVISIIVQIATIPFLLRYFQNAALLGFIANITAIPLSSFVIMPCGFLALFLMPLGLEKYALLAMEQGIFLLEKIAIFVANIDYSYFASPQLSKLGMMLAVFGLFTTCLAKSGLRFVGMAIFFSSFATLYFIEKPNILFDGKQKFFALYDDKNGLVFSKELRPSKKRELWLLRLQSSEFKSLKNFSNDWQKEQGIFCNEEFCTIEKNKKFLVLLTRTKTAEICKNDFDVIVNLTARYELPDCIASSKIKIDNADFYEKGGHFFYLSEEIQIRTTN